MLPELSRADVERLDREIRDEQVKRWVAGAKAFVEDKENRKLVVGIIVDALDEWSHRKTQKWLARFGIAALGSMIAGGLLYLGWKGWGGGK